MIRGVHTMFYSSEPEALRAFLRDKLRFPSTDVGEGWLIFDLPEADMGCHPADPEHGGLSGTSHISFYCDDIQKTVAELKARGVEFGAEIADQGYGFVTHFKVPGGFEVQLYQPKYVKQKQAPARAKPKRPKPVKKAAARKTVRSPAKSRRPGRPARRRRR